MKKVEETLYLKDECVRLVIKMENYIYNYINTENPEILKEVITQLEDLKILRKKIYNDDIEGMWDSFIKYYNRYFLSEYPYNNEMEYIENDVLVLEEALDMIKGGK